MNPQAEAFFAVVGVAVTCYGAGKAMLRWHLGRMEAVRRARLRQERARRPVDWRPAPTLVYPPNDGGRPVDGRPGGRR
jgi:hypothetical protein